MYLATDYFRKHGVLPKADVQYWSGAAKLFAVPQYEKTLLEVVKRGNIKLNFMYNLTEIDGTNHRAKFVGFGENNKDEVKEVEFDMIHVTPPQSAPDFIRNSSLANSGGWVDVDKGTLQHVRYTNIFALGDAAGLPISKTGAAIRKQAPVVVENLLSVIDGYQPAAIYLGYTFAYDRCAALRCTFVDFNWTVFKEKVQKTVSYAWHYLIYAKRRLKGNIHCHAEP